MTTPLNIETNYSLYNTDNFKNSLDVTTCIVLNKYKDYIFEFFNIILDNIKVKNNSYYKFIITRGLETITNIFTTILYYTKNIELTSFHCQKAIYFYVEFVSQISEEQNIFLQLSSRDATSYVYKKTIYELNNDFKKNMPYADEKTVNEFNIITENIKIQKNIFLKIINNIQIFINDKKQFDKCIKLSFKVSSMEIEIKKLGYFNSIIDFLDIEFQNIDKFLEIVLLLIKRISKNEDVINTCLLKIYNDDKNNYINDSPEKFITWFCQ
uniref:Uncharacterized protein n=1 Tax=viral metagenome TaxID=1070528 RepID=A0A6C0IFH6_9ZZZZ